MPEVSEMLVETGPSLVPVTVTTTVAVEVAPLGSVMVYEMVLVAVSPTPRWTNSLPGVNT
ncbi:hypothetical protein LMG26858_04751 [Achromobacter anxifer]|uniref:Uncharacterized protein n=1 Tax=Achromobacter anxifer TaxID=1287737 RepID=A0A6S7EIF0_9BURK|nr:hypothetical protein LMG26858_04751 [Achromobacter anxifer]CAB5516917.1 hypothetical protein LMG26857_05999 [Achromobacter anxifer]